MLQRLKQRIDRLLADAQRHADAGAHTPLHIEPARTARERIVLMAFGAFGIAMVPIAAALPILPTWPFVLLALAAAARSSSRARDWLTQNRAFCGLVHFIHSRPERVFRWAARLLAIMFGTS